MPHPTSPPALRVPAAPASGTTSVDPFGLTIVHLGPPLPGGPPPSQPLCSELDPPRPGALAAANPSGRRVALGVGQLVTGGMADRAVSAPVVLLPGTTSIVATEPLSSRWWPAGPPQAGGQLPPALTSLVILACHGATGLRSIARTALWEAYRRHGSPEDTDRPSGWLLLRGRTVLAARLVGGRAPRWLPTWPPPRISGVSRGNLLREGDAGTTVVRLSQQRGRRIATWLVRVSPELADAVLAGTSD